MPLVIVEDEGDVAALARRLLPSRASKAAAERVVQAIRAANPGLDLERLRPGALVVVPSVPGRRGPADLAASAAQGLLEEATAALTSLAATAEAARAVERDELEQAAAALSAPEVEKAAARDEGLREVLTELRRTLDEDETAASERTEMLHLAIASWEEDLTSLQHLVAPPD